MHFDAPVYTKLPQNFLVVTSEYRKSSILCTMRPENLGHDVIFFLCRWIGLTRVLYVKIETISHHKQYNFLIIKFFSRYMQITPCNPALNEINYEWNHSFSLKWVIESNVSVYLFRYRTKSIAFIGRKSGFEVYSCWPVRNKFLNLNAHYCLSNWTGAIALPGNNKVECNAGDSYDEVLVRIERGNINHIFFSRFLQHCNDIPLRFCSTEHFACNFIRV